MPMADFWLDMTALAGGGCATHPQREPVRAERVSWIEVSSVLRWVAGTGFGGAEGDRTLDLCIANAALSQLSYRPT